MRLRPIAMVIGLALISAPPSLAGEDNEAVFVNLGTIGSFAESGGADATGRTGARRAENDGDEVAGVAGVLGYSFGRFPFRAEADVARRFRFDFDRPDTTAQTADFETDMASPSALASATVEWRNDSGFTPFAGVTAGWARNSTDTRRFNLSTQASVEGDEAIDNFAYGGFFGLDWGFSESWSAEVAYRYLNLGDAETGAVDATDGVSPDDYVSHDVLLSILYRF